MIGKIFIPIIQLNDIEYDENFKYEVIKRYDFKNGEIRDKEHRAEMHNDSINEYTLSLYDRINMDDDYHVKDIPHIIKQCECECFITDSEDGDVSHSFIGRVIDSGRMSILKININPNTIEPDCETELKFWLDESNKLLKDRSLDKTTKMKYLPMRTFKLELGGNDCILHNCKMFRYYDNVKNAPFYFAVLVEKITC